MQVKFFQPPVTNIPRLRTDVEPRKMFGGGGVGNFSFGDFFGSNPGAGTGYYEEPQQFVDAAEEITTEQPSSGLSPAQIKLLEQGNLQTQDLGYMTAAQNNAYGNEVGTIEIPEFPGSGQNIPINMPTQPTAPTETAPPVAPDTGPTTLEQIMAAEQWFSTNNVGLPYSRQDYDSDEAYLNALNGYISSYVPPEEVVATTEPVIADQTTTAPVTTPTTEADRIEQLLDPAQLREMGYMTQEEIAEMGYMTPEQMAEQGYMSRAEFDEYLAQQTPGLTSDEVQNIIDQQDYDTTFDELTTKLDDLDTKYTSAQSQYDADATQAQIDQTKDEMNTFFTNAQHSGPRTGSTSQFTKQPSYISGSSNPMASLIKSQREATGQDPYSHYYSSFTPSYSDFNEPISAEEYGKRSGPKSFEYPNPFTQGAANGGATANFKQPSFMEHGGGVGQPNNNQGGLDSLNFQTNVDPFQRAFRPNVKRN